MGTTLNHTAFFCGGAETIENVYGKGRREQIVAMTDCYPEIISPENFEEHAPRLRQLEVIFSTWGMPLLGAEHLEKLPDLRAVFYAAGSVQGFARPLLERGITVVSAWAANAIPVAEFTLAQILLSNKGYFCNVRENHCKKNARGRCFGLGNFDEPVALLGVGQIGRKVIELLRPIRLPVMVFDPFLAKEEAQRLGVFQVSLEEAFAQGSVVSNHLANLPATVGMLQGCHFRSMKPHATFINTGRSETVRESELVEVLRERPDLTALLDLANDAGLWTCPNVQISSHIAGSQGSEVVRMADYMIEEFKALQNGDRLRYEVTLPMLEQMA